MPRALRCPLLAVGAVTLAALAGFGAAFLIDQLYRRARP